MLGFGKKLKPEEVVRKWKTDIRKQNRTLERDIQTLEVEEKKVQRIVQELVKKGDIKSAKILALELVRSKKGKERLYNSRATLNSISMQLQSQMALLRVAGSLQKSTEVMKIMSNAVKLPEIHQVILTMGAEMTKAGLIEDMIVDTLDEGEELEHAADEEIEKILLEVTKGVLEKGQKPPTAPLAQAKPVAVEDEDDKDNELSERLAGLRH